MPYCNCAFTVCPATIKNMSFLNRTKSGATISCNNLAKSYWGLQPNRFDLLGSQISHGNFSGLTISPHSGDLWLKKINYV
jgi:hypothetical protein